MITRPGCDPPPPSSLSRGWWPPVNSATLPARPWAGAVSPEAPARRRHPRGHHRLPPTASRRFRAKGGRVRAPGNRKGRKTRPSLRARKRARHAGRGGPGRRRRPTARGPLRTLSPPPQPFRKVPGGGDWHSKERRREGGGSVSCFFCVFRCAQVCTGVHRCLTCWRITSPSRKTTQRRPDTPDGRGCPCGVREDGGQRAG